MGWSYNMMGKEWKQVDTGSYDSLNSAFGFDENNIFLYGVGGRMLFWNGQKWDYREPNTIMISLDVG
ncbi:MAG: hypothetical protein CM1200mP16_03400 [Nitrospina sp.]|nr:MAG: hypothetical protein CM1200mP16_03400 [Nitrospina sp.]